MFVSRRIKPFLVLQFAWKYLVFYFLYSGLIYLLYTRFKCNFLSIPFLPIGVIGTAVAFYIGFKNNSSYERLWEARRMWGSIVNASRSWAMMVDDYITNHFAKQPAGDGELKTIKKDLIYRHLAYIYALKNQLRSKPVWENHTSIYVLQGIEEFKLRPLEEDLKPFLAQEEVSYFKARKNPATHIIKKQSELLKDLHSRGLIDDFRHMEMERVLIDFYTQQGGCERIKNFLFPRQYAIFCNLFVWLFILLLPFGMVAEFSKIGEEYVWLMIPFHMLISWVFMTMEMVGDSSENPFENALNDVPMTSICRNIEIDLREMLGETDLPAKTAPIGDILM